ncbi:MAG: NAD(P)/FAD-dependent oxidoreductase [Candidatus Omnitrophica bacterium]|nr:NAD(P)/FAD-dependent oxidoreductase [Candidatus Omnitrophota bacterium]
MRYYDVCIVGGGITGTAIARELSRYDIKIALLEKEAELAFGVSKSNSGIIHPGTQNPPNSLKGKLCVQGNLLARKLARELSIDLKEVGELIVAFNKEETSRLSQLKEDGKALGVPGLKIVNKAWLRKHEPNLSHDVIAALYSPSACVISPYRWVYNFAENAVMNGVEIYTETKVTEITPEKPGFKIRTSGKTFSARFVINAGGLYADDISGMVGVDDFKIRPRKGEEFLLDKKREHLTKHLIFPLPSKASKGILVIRTSDGNPMIGPTSEDVEDKEDLSTTAAGLKKVLANAKRLVPSINENDIIAYFAGLRPAAGDDFIIRHEDKVPGFINVAGIQSPGLTAAPAIALMVTGILKKHGLGMKKKRIFNKYRKEEAHLFSDRLLKKAGRLIKEDPEYGDIVCRCEMVSAAEVRRAIARGARTLDGIKFRTRAQAGRCHGSFCTTRLMKILSGQMKIPPSSVTKRGKGSEIVKEDRSGDK